MDINLRKMMKKNFMKTMSTYIIHTLYIKI